MFSIYLTLALLLIVGANLGLVILFEQLRTEHTRTQVYISGLKTMIASLRHELSLDRQGMDERFDQLNDSIEQKHGETRNVIESTQYEQHKKTRKETQELKTGNEWAKKRDHQVLAKLDELLARPQVKMTISDPEPKKPTNKTAKPKATK